MKTEDFICGLESDNFFVRSTSLHIVQNLPCPPFEAAHAAYRSYQKYGAEKAFEFPQLMCQLPLDKELYEKVLQAVIAAPQKLVEENMALHMLPWLAEASVDLVEKHFDELKSLPAEPFDSEFSNYLKYTLSVAEFKINLSKTPVEDLLSNLDDIFLQCQENTQFPGKEVRALEYYAEAIGGDTLSDEQIIEWLRDPAISDSNHIAGWKAGFAILVATKKKLEMATQYVLKLFDLDWDWYNEEIANFVECTAGETGLRTILDDFPTYNEEYAQLYLSAAISNCPAYPGLESRLISALKSSDDIYTESNLACYLAELGTPEGKGAAFEIYQKYDGHPEVEIIPEFLHTVYFLQGDNPGNTEKFRKIVAAQAERHRQIQENSPISMLTKKLEARDRQQPGGTFKVTNIEPEPVVGRNRPCPCGSGKKHKMCCMKKAG